MQKLGLDGDHARFVVVFLAFFTGITVVVYIIVFTTAAKPDSIEVDIGRPLFPGFGEEVLKQNGGSDIAEVAIIAGGSQEVTGDRFVGIQRIDHEIAVVGRFKLPLGIRSRNREGVPVIHKPGR